MKIQIGSYTLVDGLRDSDEEPETVATQEAAIRRALRAADAAVLPRGGRAYTFTFQKTRDHASFEEQEKFRLLHPTEIPTEGVLAFIAEGEGGTEAAIYFATHCVTQVRIRPIGTTTITTYTVSAAGPSTSPPTP